MKQQLMDRAFSLKRLTTLIVVFLSSCCLPALASDLETDYGESDLHAEIEENQKFKDSHGFFRHQIPGFNQSTHGQHGNGFRGHFQFDEKVYPEVIRPLMVQAQNCQTRHQLAEALDLYDKAIKLAPDCEPLRLRRGFTLLRQQNFKTAVNDFNFVITKNPQSKMALLGRLRCYEELGESRKALDILNKMISQNPEQGNNYMLRSAFYQHLGKSKEATSDRAKAFSLFTRNRAIYFIAQGHFTDALKVVNTGLKQEPNDRPLQIEQGKLLNDLGCFKEAISCYDKLIAAETTPEILNLRGKAYEHSGNTDQAIKDYSAAIAGSSHFQEKGGKAINESERNSLASYYQDRAHAYIKTKQYSSAISDCTICLQLHPEANAYSMRADAYALDGKLQNAMADYKTACQLNPQLQHSLVQGAQVAEKLKDYPTATKFYSELIKINPQLGDFYLARAEAYEQMNKLTEAKRDLNKCVQLDPDDEIGFESRGRINAALHEYIQAIADYTMAIKLDPDSPRLLQSRAAVYERMGNNQLAAADKKAAEQKVKKP